jgi:hypothetical protein
MKSDERAYVYLDREINSQEFAHHRSERMSFEEWRETVLVQMLNALITFYAHHKSHHSRKGFTKNLSQWLLRKTELSWLR